MTVALKKTTPADAVKGAIRDSQHDDITPEILAVIAAAATAYMGANLRILSAQLQQSPQSAVSRWTRQGRTGVMASHNLRPKR
jgi:hypothetical protein